MRLVPALFWKKLERIIMQPNRLQLMQQILILKPPTTHALPTRFKIQTTKPTGDVIMDGVDVVVVAGEGDTVT